MSNKKIKEKIFLNELNTLQERIGKYDRYSITIKGWAITLWAILIIFIMEQEIYSAFFIPISGLFVF